MNNVVHVRHALPLKMKLVHPEAKIPLYATPGAACFDFFACEDAVIPAKQAASVELGVSFEIPAGWVMNLYSRSGHGFKHGLRLVNGTGKIDSDYRGVVGAKFFNDSDTDFVFRKGDRVVQGEICPVYVAAFEVCDELSETTRGTGGFGSTGA